MFIRLTPILAALLLLLSARPSPCEQKPLRLRLAYTTVHGGLRMAVAPAKRNLPKLGLALAGGGAKAAASVGVLKVLAREGISVDAIAGTSMGAAVGGLYAAGYSADEIERIFLDNDWNDLFTDTPRRAFMTQEQKEAGSRHLLDFTFDSGGFMPPSGLSAGQKLTNLLASKTLAASFEADLDFDKLRVPFRAIATDIENGEAAVIRSGLLHEAMRASMAIPLVFQPVEIQGRLLVDGGLVNNLPVDVAKSLGADMVIAVDASTKLETKERLGSLIDIMGQSISLPVRRECERQAALADLVITPDTAAYSFADFPGMHEIIKKGEEAAQAALPRVRELLRSKTAARTDTDRFRVMDVVIRGNAVVPEAVIRAAMTLPLSPAEVSRNDLFDAMIDVYRLGVFADVALDLEKAGDGARAVITVAENPVVWDIAVSGNTIMTKDEFLTALGWQKGQMLNVMRLAEELDKITSKCRAQGYLLTRVARVGMNAETSELEIEMFEGRVDSVSVVGQKKTRRSLIQRETVTRAGRPLNFDRAAYDIQHLYALNYFESLSADMAKSPEGGVDLTLRIKEKPTTRVRLGLRYDLEDRFTGLTDIIMDNVTGRGIKTYLNMRYGNYTDFTLGYRSPVLLHSNFVHSVQVFYRSRQYFEYEDKHRINEFEVTRTGAELAFGYQWFRFGDTYLRYRFATDDMEETIGETPSRDEERIGTFALLSTIDTRDRSTFPSSGVLFKGSYETAQRAYGSAHEFSKTSLSAQGAMTFAQAHTILLEGSAGLGSGALPYQERFGIGGADYLLGFPLMGFERREFTGTNELGFSATYRWRMKEYHLKAVKAVYLNSVVQAANVWDDRDALSVSDLRNGGGIGLHADTIIGPVRLDFGWGEQSRYTVYFSAGYDF